MSDDIPTMRTKINEALAAVEENLLDEYPELVKYFRASVIAWETYAGFTIIGAINIYAYSFRTKEQMIQKIREAMAREAALQNKVHMAVSDEQLPEC